MLSNTSKFTGEDEWLEEQAKLKTFNILKEK
jgi:hypothetical protein